MFFYHEARKTVWCFQRMFVKYPFPSCEKAQYISTPLCIAVSFIGWRKIGKVKVMGSWEGIVAFSCRITRACRSVDTCCFILFSHGHLQAMDSWAKLSSPCQEGVVGSTTSPTVHNAEFVMQLKQWRAVRTQRRGQCARMNYTRES